jgi:hypothetical protein
MNGKDCWHTGFAWAMTRTAYERLGGLFDKGVVGGGDNIMALSLINKVILRQQPNYHKDYNKSMSDYQIKASNLRLGYVPGVIRHHYHGSKSNRKYVERKDILISNGYSPTTHVTYDDGGILIPSYQCPQQLLIDIMNYFVERKEDD